MLSGRSTVVASNGRTLALDIIRQCCGRLEIQGRGREALVHGAEVVPNGIQDASRVENWPGLRPRGEVSEYQLIV
eukprot:743513-Amphidinium_carterae.1